MFYRFDTFSESSLNPVTSTPFDERWAIFVLTDCTKYNKFVGSTNGCAYTVKFSRHANDDWRLALGDFIGYNEAAGKNSIVILSETELNRALYTYTNHTFDETELRPGETKVLVHSTPLENLSFIQKDGTLKSFNLVHTDAQKPIGAQLGDPPDFSNYIMFSNGGVTGEIVVNSKQSGKINMDVNTAYIPGARLYFDAKKIAADGLLIRDGCHLKVKDRLPLAPYLICTVTAEMLHFENEIITPLTFSQKADAYFHSHC